MNAAPKVYQCIVVGLGAAGSAALYHLARRGVQVLGLEAQPAVAHDRGSSHGGSRIIRLVYQEHPSYVPLLARSYELWRELEAATSHTLLVTTGCINASVPGSTAAHGHSCYDGAVRSAEESKVPYETLDAAQVAERFPGYALPAGFKAVLDPAGGFLYPERGIQAHIQAAEEAGAQVMCNTPINKVTPRADGLPGADVHTANGTFTADSVVVAAGAWMPALVPELAPLLSVERQVVGWFKPTAHPERFAKECFPVYLIDDESGYYYGFPADDEGLVKLGKYNHLNEVVASPEDLDRRVRPDDEAALRLCLMRCFPDLAAGEMAKSSVCMFTNTPDGHFIMDRHPGNPGVVLASACAGHGYKFAPVLGEILADLVTEGGKTRHDIGMHRLDGARPGHADVIKALKASNMKV